MENWGDMNGVAHMDWGLWSEYGWVWRIWMRIGGYGKLFEIGW